MDAISVAVSDLSRQPAASLKARAQGMKSIMFALELAVNRRRHEIVRDGRLMHVIKHARRACFTDQAIDR